MTESTLVLTGPLNPRGGWQATNCPIAHAIDVVGNRSAFLLLREAFYGTTRFDDFAQRVGISESVAALRLKNLVDSGMLERRPYREPGARTRYEYHLTEMGADFFPIIAGLMCWGDRWAGPAGVRMQHHDCGAPVHAELRCEKGHALAVTDVDLVANRRRRR